MKDEIIKVHFHRLHKGKHDYYYSSLAKMYKQLTANEVGICRQALANAKIFQTKFYANPFCTIEVITINNN